MNLGPLEPYAAMIRIGAVSAVGIAALGFGASWYMRGQEIEDLHTWQDQVLTATAVASGLKDLDPDSAVTAIQVLGADVTECRTNLDEIDRNTRKAKAQSDASDAALRVKLAEQSQRYTAATRKIESLSARVAAPSAEAAAAQIEADSKAAWEGWKQ